MKALGALFTQILQLCETAGLVKLGHVALDGTKIKANASKHKAMSYERMEKRAVELEAEVASWLAAAEAIDATEDKLYGADKTGAEMPDWEANLEALENRTIDGYVATGRARDAIDGNVKGETAAAPGAPELGSASTVVAEPKEAAKPKETVAPQETVESTQIAVPQETAESKETAAPNPQAASKPTRVEAMRAKIKAGGHTSPYRLRKQLPEPVFGQIKQARGFRQFLLRGFEKVCGEWAIVCAAPQARSRADSVRSAAASGLTSQRRDQNGPAPLPKAPPPYQGTADLVLKHSPPQLNRQAPRAAKPAHQIEAAATAVLSYRQSKTK